MLTVRMRIGALIFLDVDRSNREVVVPVVLVARRNSAQKLLHIPQQLRLVFVEFDRGRCVLGRDHGKAGLHARFVQDMCNRLCYVDELWGTRRVDRDDGVRVGTRRYDFDAWLPDRRFHHERHRLYSHRQTTRWYNYFTLWIYSSSAGFVSPGTRGTSSEAGRRARATTLNAKDPAPVAPAKATITKPIQGIVPTTASTNIPETTAHSRPASWRRMRARYVPSTTATPVSPSSQAASAAMPMRTAKGRPNKLRPSGTTKKTKRKAPISPASMLRASSWRTEVATRAVCHGNATARQVQISKSARPTAKPRPLYLQVATTQFGPPGEPRPLHGTRSAPTLPSIWTFEDRYTLLPKAKTSRLVSLPE